jgi:hypothetical protein
MTTARERRSSWRLGFASPTAAHGYVILRSRHPGRTEEGEALIVADGKNYVVIQVVLKEKFIGTGSGNLTELEQAINAQAALGYRLHTITTASSGSKGFGGGDRIQATLVFERI